MYQPLHLKYRPKNLQELVGQDTIKTTLTNAITSDKIAQAYLFTGPRGTGKTSTARILAKSLNCLNSKKPTATPCGECSSCKTIDSCSSLDVTEIDAASHNGVDDARELIQHSNFAPAMSRYRIWILDECHQLSTSAQNALLKCLEEPPAHVVFILCTTEAHKVLPTIISRCQTFNFRALSVDA
ncbi:DNA polymerase III subunit gamma/tau, partial [Microcoleus sp. F6_B3]